MPSRYAWTVKMDNGKYWATWNGGNKLYWAVNSGLLSYSTRILKEGTRLDHLAGAIYGDGALYWVIAAASGIGWGLQVPPGTIIKIPTNPGLAMIVARK